MANERKKKQTNRPPARDVTYIPPEPLNRKKLLLRLLTVAAVVVALFVGCSIFFKVDTIRVSGMEKYTAWAVREASGIEEGESLLTIGKAQACGRIIEELPYVKTVRIGITLPGTVNIYIEELDVVYSVQDVDGGWWLLTSDGRIVEKTSGTEAARHTQLLGFQITEPKAGEQAVAMELEPDATDESGERVVITVTNEERMETALQIVTRLEANEILGEVASVDVTNLEDIQLWYGKQYQVLLGDPGNLDEKIDTMKTVIDQEDSHQSGILDITFTEEEGKVVYTPFE